MPRKPPHPCPHCGTLTATRCTKCTKRRQRASDATRPGPRQRGYTPTWERERLIYLRAHPLCVRCEADGRVTLAECVDHVIPHKGDPVKFWTRANWQALCLACHAKKTALEDGAFGRFYARAARELAENFDARHTAEIAAAIAGGQPMIIAPTEGVGGAESLEGPDGGPTATRSVFFGEIEYRGESE